MIRPVVSTIVIEMIGDTLVLYRGITRVMEEAESLETIRLQKRAQTQPQVLESILRTREQYLSSSPCELGMRRRHIFQEFPEAHICGGEPWGVILTVQRLKDIASPPIGYGYKGGAARLALQAALGLPTHGRRPRDLDLIRVSSHSDTIDTLVASKVSPDDAQYGFGVECITNFQHYLNTRDITLNEVIVFQERVIASYQAINDMKDGTLRVTAFGLTQDLESQNRIAAKMLRLEAEAQYFRQPSYTLILPPLSTLSLFSFLLHLERTLTEKQRLAELFIQLCSQHGCTPQELEGACTLQHVVKQLRHLPKIRVSSFPFLSQLLKKPQRKTKSTIRL